MSNKLQPLKGMKDILPDEQYVHTHIVNSARSLGELYGFREMSTPLLELVSVFDRSLGESSDVVSKEMYDFRDKGDRHISLRPEFTASVMRAVITNSLHTSPIKLFSSGPLFRYDRPQAGRLRQFHQLNFENIGSKEVYSDAETIELAARLLNILGIDNKITLELNSLGCRESRAKYAVALQEYFSKYENDLSEDSKQRLGVNPLRIMDSKDESDKKLSLGAPTIDEFYDKESAESFENVQNHLNILGVEYIVNKRLARGLDYYCHTTFEFTTEELGAQGTVLAGGRYDGLSKLLGGPELPAIGFAAGIERMAMLMDFEATNRRKVCIMPIGSDDQLEASRLASLLRSSGVCTYIDGSGKMPKRMQRAVANSALYVVFIGESERNLGQYKLKNLDDETENVYSMAAAMKILRGDMNR